MVRVELVRMRCKDELVIIERPGRMERVWKMSPGRWSVSARKRRRELALRAHRDAQGIPRRARIAGREYAPKDSALDAGTSKRTRFGTTVPALDTLDHYDEELDDDAV